MKESEKIGMPYSETDEYVSRLVANVTEHAIAHRRSHRHTIRRSVAAAASVLLVLTGAGIAYHYHRASYSSHIIAQKQVSPVDEFLSSITDEEAMMLTSYEIEEINY